VIEESPTPALDDEGRSRLCADAVRLARAMGYRCAGTLEFLVDAAGRHHFLELNARLQVEHPVTELLTGRDLVHAQVRAARGEPLPFRQEEITRRGHVIECRVYAEDPARDFMPSTGTLRVYEEPCGPGIRVDGGFRQGSSITPHFDALLAKVIVQAETRAEAIRRMDLALSRFVILGIRTNIAHLRKALSRPEFVSGRYTTQLLAGPALGAPTPCAEALALAAALLEDRPAGAASASLPAASVSPWSAGRWRAGE
jgi:acetyl/propionyl-CoA carboxylase alpha subunit